MVVASATRTATGAPSSAQAAPQASPTGSPQAALAPSPAPAANGVRGRAEVGARLLRRPGHHVVGHDEADALVPRVLGAVRTGLGTPPSEVETPAAGVARLVPFVPAVLLLTIRVRRRPDAGPRATRIATANQAVGALGAALEEAPVTSVALRPVLGAAPVQGVRLTSRAVVPAPAGLTRSPARPAALRSLPSPVLYAGAEAPPAPAMVGQAGRPTA